MNSQKTVELVVRARDESQRALNSAKAGLSAFVSAQQRAATYRGLAQNQRDTATAATQAAKALRTVGLAASGDQVRGFKAAREAARRAKEEVQAYKAALARAPAPTMGAIPGIAALPDQSTQTAPAVAASVQMEAATERERKAALGAAAAARQHALAMGVQGKAAREVAAAEQALTAVQMSVDASAEQVISAQRRMTAAYAAAETASRRVTAAQHSVANAQKQVQRSSNDAASSLARAWSSRKGRGFLGLRPYELQNLSYQLNDVFTQIASGTPITQVAAQQGGQFAQIFPRAGAGLLRFLPVIGLVTVALSPFISAMNKANAEAASLKEFDLLLTRSGNAAAYTAPHLAALAASLDDYGGSLKDARAALTEFVGDAVDPAYLERFGKAALDLSKVMDMKVADAAKKVSDAFTGNADAILALDDELGFLTETERKHAEGLRKQQRDAELRTQAFAAFERQYGETAAKMRGPWSQILSNFGALWNTFVDTVNFIDFGKAARQIDDLVQRIQRLTSMLPGANKSTLDAARATFLRNAAEIERLEDAGGGGGGAMGGGRYRANRLRTLRREQTGLETTIAIREAQANGGLLGPGPTPDDTTTRPPAAAYTPPKGGRSDAERLAEQRKQFLESLHQESVARQFNLSLIDLNERQSLVLTAIEQARVRAAELGLELTKEQLDTIQSEVRAQYDAEQAAKGRLLIEQATLELAQARNEIESEGDFVARKLREQGLAGIQEMDDATGEVVVTLTREGAAYADILRSLYRINEATRQRTAAEKEVNDLTSLRSDLLQQIQFYQDAGEQGTADRLREQLVEVNAELLLAVDGAINFWTAIGGDGAEAALLKLGLLRDQLKGVGEQSIVSGTQINEMLADGGVNAIDQFFQSLGEGANAIVSLGNAFRQFAADFLRQIGQMIAKQLLLNALQSALGGGGKGDKGGGVGAAISSAIGALFRHDGGLVGQGGGFKSVPLSAFAGATRYHTGGIVGLKPDEVPSILKRNEEVLTEGDPRHRANGGRQRGGGNVRVINVFDPADALQRGLASEAGERVLMNFFSKNAGAIKATIA